MQGFESVFDEDVITQSNDVFQKFGRFFMGFNKISLTMSDLQVISINIEFTTQKKFEETAEFVRTWHPATTPSNDDKLAGYALYKQATIGDCNTPAPGMFSFTVGLQLLASQLQEKAKWNAWNNLKGKLAR